MIRRATPSDASALQTIWAAAFADATEYPAHILQTCLTLGTVIYDPQAQSFLTLLPLLLQTPEGVLPGSYVYGVATHPLQQGGGHATRLLAYAAHLALKMRQHFLLLFPATPSLQAFYKQRGYEDTVQVPAAALLSAEQLPPIAPFSLAQYNQTAAEMPFAFCWPEPLLQFVRLECLWRGGFATQNAFCYPAEAAMPPKWEVKGAALKGPLQTARVCWLKEKPHGYDTGGSWFAFPLD